MDNLMNGKIGTFSIPSSICDDYTLTNDYFSPSIMDGNISITGSTGATWVYPQATTLPYYPPSYGSPITSAGLVGGGFGSLGGMFTGIFQESKLRMTFNIVDAPKTVRRQTIKIRMKK